MEGDKAAEKIQHRFPARLKTLPYDFKTTGVKKDEGEDEGKVEEEEEGQEWPGRLAPGPDASFHSTSLLDACSIHTSPLEGKQMKWFNSHGSTYLGKSVQPTEGYLLGIQVYIIS